MQLVPIFGYIKKPQRRKLKVGLNQAGDPKFPRILRGLILDQQHRDLAMQGAEIWGEIWGQILI